MSQSVSVALAVYNGEKYLAEQLDSLLNQSLVPSEIVVSDDNSTDKSLAIMKTYEKAHPGLFIILHNKKQLGYIRNFEQCLKYCSSEYIALCDQDDIWHREKLEKLCQGIGTASLAYSDAELIDATGKIIAQSYNAYSGRKGKPDFGSLLFNNTISGCTMLFNKRLLKNAFPFPEHIPHDYWLALLAADAEGIQYVDEPLIQYRQHDSNAIGAKSSESAPIHRKKLQSYIKNKETIHRNRKKRYEELLRLSSAIKKRNNYKKLLGLYLYHATFFTQWIRLRAFLYHLCHIRQFNFRKNAIQAIVNLLTSLIGLKLFKACIKSDI